MRVAFATHNISNGGASLAVSRLARGFADCLDEYNCRITLLTSIKEHKDFRIHSQAIDFLFSNYTFDLAFGKVSFAAWRKLHGTNANPRFFSMLGRKNISFYLDNFDIVNLFWIQRFLDLKKVNLTRQPLVITLHDMWFLTGGCSYSFDCKKFESGCHGCEEIRKPFQSNIAKQFQIKNLIVNREDIRFVVTSRWMYEIATNRGITPNRLTLIPNYIPSTYQYLGNKSLARKLLGLPHSADSKTVLYFVGSTTDPRKGFDLFQDALSLLPKSKRSQILLVHLGPFNKTTYSSTAGLSVEIFPLGIYSDEVSQIIAYNSADYLICPSRFDNSPNVIAEALMCGLPVVTSIDTGCSEMITERLNGLLANTHNADDFSTLLGSIVDVQIPFDSTLIASSAASSYGHTSTVQKYYELYKQLFQ